jgi:sugar lactone lactonase YvrE
MLSDNQPRHLVLPEPLPFHTMNPYFQISAAEDRVGESPVWSVQEQQLYWVDIERHLIRRARLVAGSEVQSWELPQRVGCIALASDGRVIAAMEDQIAAVRLLPQGAIELQTLARIQHPAGNMRFNDGRCDAQGRLWVGTLVMDMSLASDLGALYCLDERGLSGPHVSGLRTANGLGFSPDGRTLYLSDSHPTVQKIWAFDFDAQTGTLSGRREFVDMKPLPGRPDGAAVDARGHYWICGNDAGQIHCFEPSGRLEKSLHVPLPKPSMCAFAGPDLQTLAVASIKPADLSTDPMGLSGALLALPEVGQGQPEPLFSSFPHVA